MLPESEKVATELLTEVALKYPSCGVVLVVTEFAVQRSMACQTNLAPAKALRLLRAAAEQFTPREE